MILDQICAADCIVELSGLVLPWEAFLDLWLPDTFQTASIRRDLPFEPSG
jgi:hypothetical protein